MKKTISSVVIGANALAVAMAMLNSQAHAAPATSANASANAKGTLEEVVVTAQRRQQRLEEVPIAIASVSAEQLQNAGVSSVVSLPQSVPGLRFDLSGPYVQPTIRGVGSPLVGPGLNSNIATYVDGFYVPNALGTDMKLMSVSGVQVLKGPQGTLFGRNATGGAILISTRKPSFTPAFTARVSYGKYNKRDVSFYGSDGLTDSIAFDLAGYKEKGDGYVKNIVTGGDANKYDRWAIRGKLLFNIADNSSVTLAYGHNEIDDPSAFVTSSYDGQTSASAYDPSVVVATKWNQTSNGGKAQYTLNSNTFYLTGDFDLGFAGLKSYTQYRDDKSKLAGDYDGTQFPVMAPNWEVKDKTFTQEFDLASDSDQRLTWVLGLFYYNNQNDYPYYNVTIFGSPEFRFFTTKSNTKSYAGFGDFTYQLTDRLYLTAGLRYSVDDVEGSFDAPGAGGISGSKSTRFNKSTSRINLRYALSDQSSVYVSYNQGYKAGFVPVSAFSTKIIQPEKIDAYEIGFKTAQDTYRFDTSAFYYDYTNLQVAAYINSAAIYTNAANSEIYGADFQFTADITDSLNLVVGGTYVHAKYKSFPNAVDYTQDLNPSSPAYGLFVNPLVDASGNVMPRSPKFSGNVGLNYMVPVSVGSLALNANLYYTTKFYFDSPERYSQGAYRLFNLKATYTTADEHWAYSLYGTNLTDSHYRNQVLPGTFAIQQTYGAPREYGASITYKY